MIAAALLILMAVLGEPPRSYRIGECIAVSGQEARLTLAGRLRIESFPGRPDYESLAAGDEEERTFLLELANPICVDDGGEFANPAERFDRVHLWGSPEVMAALRRAVGEHVEVIGRGYAAHSGHHHAPLVLQVDRVIVIEGWTDD